MEAKKTIVLNLIIVTLSQIHSYSCRWSQCPTNSSRSHCCNSSGPVRVYGNTGHCSGDWCRDARQKTEALAKEEKVCPTLTRWSVYSNEIGMQDML